MGSYPAVADDDRLSWIWDIFADASGVGFAAGDVISIAFVAVRLRGWDYGKAIGINSR